MIQMNNTVISIRGNETVIIRMPKDNTVIVNNKLNVLSGIIKLFKFLKLFLSAFFCKGVILTDKRTLFITARL